MKKRRVTELKDKIETQRRRAARPTLPVNAHATKSKSMEEKRAAQERKQRQRRDWESD